MAKVFEYYQYEQAKGIPGGKADATNDDVFSYAAEESMNPGVPVILGTDPDTQIKVAGTSGDGAKCVGITVHTNKLYTGTGDYYEAGYSVPVMRKGDIFVEAGVDVTAGEAVGLFYGDDGVTFAASTDSQTVTVAGKNTYTVTTNAVANDTVTFGGVTLTGDAVSNGFTVGASAAATAANLATAMNADTTLNATYTFAATGAVVTVTEKTAGGGNTPGTMTFTGTIVISAGTATTSSSKTVSADALTGATYLESASEGDIVTVRILK